MTTEEMNIEIAKYMGWADKIFQSFTPPNEEKRFCSPDANIALSYKWDDFEDELPYHASWSHLMPVWQKLRGELLSITTHERSIQCRLIEKAIAQHCDITTAHRLMVEAIELIKK